jgi:hypothetical protein
MQEKPGEVNRTEAYVTFINFITNDEASLLILNGCHTRK